jgi:hypothetical protein
MTWLLNGDLMPKKNGKRDAQETEQGYEIPAPERSDVVYVLDKAR